CPATLRSTAYRSRSLPAEESPRPRRHGERSPPRPLPCRPDRRSAPPVVLGAAGLTVARAVPLLLAPLVLAPLIVAPVVASGPLGDERVGDLRRRGPVGRREGRTGQVLTPYGVARGPVALPQREDVPPGHVTEHPRHGAVLLAHAPHVERATG